MEILKEQKGNALKFYFFITEDFRLEYISVQGRVLLIYYFMTVIVSSFSYFGYWKKDFLLHLCVFFYVVSIMLL